MIISTQLFLQKPLCLSWTKNRMFLSQIQISEQFPGNLSCCQKLGGGVGEDCDLSSGGEQVEENEQKRKGAI